MKQPLILIYSVLVFLIALFLYQVVFYALGAVLVFLVGSSLVEIIWQYRKSEKLWRILRPIISLSVSSVLAVCLYCLFFLPVDFFLTEIAMVSPKLPKPISLLVMVLFVLFFVFFRWQNVFKKKTSYIFILFFIFASGFFYLGYRDQKLALEYLPKIYSVEGDWGIQGMTVIVKGVNFGPTWKRGMVLIGQNLLNPIDWNENQVTAEVTVPNKFGNFPLVVVRYDGILSNSHSYEIRDPKTLEDNLKTNEDSL